MKDGSIDAMFWSGGLPTSGITDLFVSQRDQVKFIDVTDTLDKLQEINPIYERGVIPASTYQTPADVPTVVVPNLLLVKDDMDGNTACVLTKALFDHKADLVKANKAADGITLDTARQTSPVPLHPGAKKALDELGAKPADRERSRRQQRPGRRPRDVSMAAAAYEEEKPARELTGLGRPRGDRRLCADRRCSRSIRCSFRSRRAIRFR